MKWVPPARLAADFEFLRPLGHGGMGHVFLVRHLELDRLAAIKLIKGAEEPARVRRFSAPIDAAPPAPTGSWRPSAQARSG